MLYKILYKMLYARCDGKRVELENDDFLNLAEIEGKWRTAITSRLLLVKNGPRQGP